jgi:hypothetical protein
LPVQAWCAGDTGQAPGDRGGRCRKAPRWMAASLDRQPPARLMARWLVRPVCVLGSAARASRLRQALQDHGATVPHPTGPPVHHPTARWVVQAWGGLPVRLSPGPWPVVLKRTEAHPPRLKRLGTPYDRFARRRLTHMTEAVRNVG